jgi:hypothetical protein
MSHVDDLGPTYQRPADAAVAKKIGWSVLDWAVLVITFALGCTLAWIYFLLWLVASALQIVLF